MLTNFIDIQVNGYGGVNFHNPDLTADQLHHACTLLQRDSVAGILATIVSEQPDIMLRSLDKIVRYRNADPLIKSIIRGIHIEGPFMSGVDGYRGAHPKAAMQPVNMDVIKQFFDACQGLLRILTLAPEQDPGSLATAWLSARKVTVSGGHSNASLDQLHAAIDHGLSMWTHLGNGCPMLMHRHDNIIQRVLSCAANLWLCFIGDGTHVPLFTLQNYLKIADFKRVIVTTDCIGAAGMGPGRYTHGEYTVDVGEDLVCWAPDKSHFVGSAATMQRCAKNLASLGLSESQIADLLIHHPAQIVSPA